MQRRREDGWRQAAFLCLAVVLMLLLVSTFPGGFEPRGALRLPRYTAAAMHAPAPAVAALCSATPGTPGSGSAAGIVSGTQGAAGLSAVSGAAGASGAEVRLSIGYLHDGLHTLCSCTLAGADVACNLLNRLYEISWRQGRLSLPEVFKPRVRAWVGNNEALFDEVPLQVSVGS
jgi:hypothetical protein